MMMRGAGTQQRLCDGVLFALRGRTHSRIQEDVGIVRRAVLLALGLSPFFPVCSSPATCVSVPVPISSTVPSSLGTPNSVVAFGSYEFVSVQGTGQIFTYNISSGSLVLAVAPYAMPCSSPSGMAIATISGNVVMAVVCYDTGTLSTLTVNADGSLSALGSVSGLPMPYPGIALDGTNVLVPLFGSDTANGGVAKVSIASPATPVIVATVTLASPASGDVANAGYLAVASGFIYVTSGSESVPQSSSSSIQVVNEATMTLVGSPLVVAHSPQQIALQGNVAYVTFFDALQLESINIANPAGLQPLQVLSLSMSNQSCNAVPIIVQSNLAYVGCYPEGYIDRFDVSNPSNMQLSNYLTGIPDPQRLAIAGGYLLITSSMSGGPDYMIALQEFN
jgi:hypothetical protein